MTSFHRESSTARDQPLSSIDIIQHGCKRLIRLTIMNFNHQRTMIDHYEHHNHHHRQLPATGWWWQCTHLMMMMVIALFEDELVCFILEFINHYWIVLHHLIVGKHSINGSSDMSIYQQAMFQNDTQEVGPFRFLVVACLGNPRWQQRGYSI